jgi:hypothetical protein
LLTLSTEQTLKDGLECHQRAEEIAKRIAPWLIGSSGKSPTATWSLMKTISLFARIVREQILDFFDFPAARLADTLDGANAERRP